jgi:hypothetical protein
MNEYQADYARGAAAMRAGEPYDHSESPVWIIGYGDAILIEPCPPPESPDE